MSATIPETALIKDLLKPTGYDCPEDIASKTFAEATAGDSKVIESSKSVTIDVSTYTEPIEITPTTGNDGMAKVIVTLTGIA